MKKPPRTAAEQQIEALRQLKQTQAKRKAAPPPTARPARTEGPPAPRAAAFELSERPAAPAARKPGPSLPLSVETWRRLRERQREHHEFARRRDMGDWAAELLLALPPGVYAMGAAAHADLLEHLREWAKARGL